MPNKLYYGDNLPVLRDHFADESVDLIYLDPPFNSNRDYSVFFEDEAGVEAEAQVIAFEDSWHWTSETEKAFAELVTDVDGRVGLVISALRQALGRNQMTAYLVMMAIRLVELHRVLKPTGSLYLHCDPTASHYLKVLLDAVFGAENFKNEITWKRSSAHNDTKQGRKALGNIADIVLFYTKSSTYTFNVQYTPYDEEYLRSTYNNVDSDGRRWKSSDITGPGGATKGNPYFEFLGVSRYWRFSKENLNRMLKEGRIYQSKPGAVPRMKHYLDEMPGVPLQNIWDDISPLSSQSAERLGYPTQKPVALLERIIALSSNPGDVVLDPFCGCGTSVMAAQKLERQWLGIDITNLAISLQKYRLKDGYGLESPKDYEVIGEPVDLASARQLAHDDPYQFQWWALGLIKARPEGAATSKAKTGKKGSDKGIDGTITFLDDNTGKAKRALVQVKGGKVKSGDVRDLRGTVEREGAAAGIFITLDTPTRDMLAEATAAGHYHSPGWNRDYPKMQIFTVEQLLDGAEVKLPPATITFKQAKREKPAAAKSKRLVE